jgi:hypothetical protein
MIQCLSGFNWHIDSKGYAYRHNYINGKDKPIRMHRQITGAKSGIDVDHINRDRLDNRNANLRLCSRSQNLWNTKKKASNKSGFKGVDYRPSRGVFRSRIRVGTIRMNLGHFKSAEDAHKAYIDAAKIHHGEFANYES